MRLKIKNKYNMGEISSDAIKNRNITSFKIIGRGINSTFSGKNISCLQLHVDKTYLWSSPTTVLAWISSPSSI